MLSPIAKKSADTRNTYPKREFVGWGGDEWRTGCTVFDGDRGGLGGWGGPRAFLLGKHSPPGGYSFLRKNKCWMRKLSRYDPSITPMSPDICVFVCLYLYVSVWVCHKSGRVCGQKRETWKRRGKDLAGAPTAPLAGIFPPGPGV